MGRDEFEAPAESSCAPHDDAASGRHSADKLSQQPSALTRAILVLGMHRSGTSATAGLIASMGAFAGEESDLLPAHPQDNPAGYWERNDLMLAQDEFLRSAGHSWERVAGFDLQRVDTPARRKLERHVRGMVSGLNARGGPWLIKDPRLSLLLPLWLPIAGDAACVVVVRDPREIAASLCDTHRGVFGSQFPLVLWEKYTRAMLDSLHRRRVLFVAYAELLADPEGQCRRLQLGLAALGVSGLHAIAPARQRALDQDLHRSRAEAHVKLDPDQAALYAWLATQALAPGPVTVEAWPQAPHPDRLLAEFEAAFDYHIEQGRQRARAETAEQLHRIENQLAAHANEREHWRSQLTNQHQQLTEQALTLAHAEHARDAAHVALAQRAAEVASFAQQLHAQHRSATELSDAVRAMRASWSWKITAPLRGIVGLLKPSVRAEQRLYRLYYALPGMNAARKRAAVLWVHRHLPWLTRHTLSYRLYQQTQDLLQRRRATLAERERLQRMDAARAAKVLETLGDAPTISIAMPVYNVDAAWLEAAVESVRRQFYPHWQLCIADDASTRAETRRALDALQQQGDARILVRRLPHNLGIAGASNAALEMCTGAFVGLLDNDDVLTRDALLEMAVRIKADDPDLLYSDEDKLDENGFNVEPHFKPDYNEDYLFSINYICHFSVIRRELLQRVGGFRSGFDGAQDYDLLLRVTEQTGRIAHIPKVLYHWRRSSSSTAADSGAKPQTSAAGRRALAESLARRGIAAEAKPGPFPNTFDVRRTIRGEPLISILVPFRDKPELLEACVDSILKKSTYRNFEIVGIDNNSSGAATQALLRSLQQRDSRVRFVRYEAPFNYSAINNFGARHARGEYLLFLNNDTEVIAPDWLEALLAHAQRPEVGVVGAKLLYADDTLQHAGVIIGLGGVAGHAHLFLAGDDPGYFSRAQLTQQLSAVTFACAMTRRDVFEKIGGLNETQLCIAFNDIDFCLRAREAGYLVVYTPDAVLHHYESKSRGYEDTPEKQIRFGKEIRYMQERHAEVLRRGDPHYNPNLSLSNNYQPDPGYADALPL